LKEAAGGDTFQTDTMELREYPIRQMAGPASPSPEARDGDERPPEFQNIDPKKESELLVLNPKNIRSRLAKMHVANLDINAVLQDRGSLLSTTN